MTEKTKSSADSYRRIFVKKILILRDFLIFNFSKITIFRPQFQACGQNNFKISTFLSGTIETE
jgi:hypothetical protein